MTIPITAASRHVALPQPGDPEAPGPFAFADPERVKRILSRAEFGEIETNRVIEKETARMLLELGPLNAIAEEIDETTRAAILADIRSALAPFESEGRVSLDATAWLVTACVG